MHLFWKCESPRKFWDWLSTWLLLSCQFSLKDNHLQMEVALGLRSDTSKFQSQINFCCLIAKYYIYSPFVWEDYGQGNLISFGFPLKSLSLSSKYAFWRLRRVLSVSQEDLAGPYECNNVKLICSKCVKRKHFVPVRTTTWMTSGLGQFYTASNFSLDTMSTANEALRGIERKLLKVNLWRKFDRCFKT